ncbi:MAG: hypothetical protein DRP35_11510 [Candidatus Zixiibacteriota bacterium]|nr:MAG: hypothetical protein DRP35_11510 [candidate division Zixibacteria bacterium]
MRKFIIFPFCFVFLAFNSFAQPNHSDTLDVLHYDINLDITNISGQTISGNTVLSATPKIDNLAYFPLDLQALTVDSVFVNDTLCSFSYNDTLIHILPAHAYNSQDTVWLNVFYHGHPITDPSGWGGFYFSGSSTAYNLGVGFQDIPHNYGRVWFPCLDDFNDRATYDFIITTADNLTAVCNGTMEQVTDNGDGTKTWHWILHQSIPTYLASVAVSNYVAVTDTFNSMTGPIPIGIYVLPGDSTDAIGSFSHLKQILAGFEQYFGPYRWERVGYVGVPFNSGAMEHATSIAYPSAVIDGGSSYEYLYAHELSHHWFGDYLTCASAEDMWINEGWAVFAESFYHEFLYDKPTYVSYLMSTHANAIRVAEYDDGGIYPLYPMPQNTTYGTTTYDKGASVVHTLRNYFGDTLFFNAVRAYVTAFGLKDVSSYDLQDFLTTYTGIDMTDFFDGWVFSPGYPHFSVDSFSVVPNGGNYDVTVYVRQRLRERTNFTNSNRVEVSFSDDLWHFQAEEVNFSGEFGQASFSLPFEPTHAYMDLNQKMCDARTTGSKVISSVAVIPFSNTYLTLYVNQISDSAFIQVEHNWVAPDPFEIGIPGLYLTDKRYWKVEGILPDTFNITARFLYSVATTGSYAHLDYGFLIDSPIH